MPDNNHGSMSSQNRLPPHRLPVQAQALEANLAYTLPPAVKSICEGWRSTFGSAATISSLLAAVEASMVNFFKDDKNFESPESTVQEVILILTYAAIILSISATISALTLTDEFGEIPNRACRERGCCPDKMQGGDWDILRRFGIRDLTQWIVYHWLICLLLAGLCAISSITLYAVTQEGKATGIVISIITVLATVPPLVPFVVPHRTTPS